MFAPCHIKLLSDLQGYLRSRIRFVDKSKYESVNVGSSRSQRYPIGLLNGEIEVHFQHYVNGMEAEERWYRRVHS